MRIILGVAAGFILLVLLFSFLAAPIGSAPSLEITQKSANSDWFQQEVLDSPLPVVVDFGATWCGPCRMISPMLDKLATDYKGKIKVVKIDIEEKGDLAQAFKVDGIPLVVIVKDGKSVNSMTGVPYNFQYSDLEHFVRPYLN